MKKRDYRILLLMLMIVFLLNQNVMLYRNINKMSSSSMQFNAKIERLLKEIKEEIDEKNTKESKNLNR